MKRVEWWTAKVYTDRDSRRRKHEIDLWSLHKTEAAAHAHARGALDDNGHPVFRVVKVTTETVPTKRAKR